MIPLIQIQEMRQQGMSESDIIMNLKQQNYNPLEITQALEQSKIKSAVSSEEMQPSLLVQETAEQEQTQEYTPQEYAPPQYQPQPTYQQPQFSQEYPQEYPQYQAQSQPSSEMFSEIAEQIAEEKMNLLKRNLGNVEELKIMLSRKVENIDDRLKKIETTIDKIQEAIIGKVGGYGRHIEDIKEEMKMMQDTFSKSIHLTKKKK